MQPTATLVNLQKFLTLLDPALDPKEMLTKVARQLVEMFGVDHSGVLFFGQDDIEGEVVAEYPPQGLLGVRLSLVDYPLADRLKAEKRPIAVLEAQRDPIMGSTRPNMQQMGIQSILVIPLIVKDKLIGGLGLDAMRGPRSFTAEELELGLIIGQQIAVAVDYAYALETVRAQQQQAQTLREVNRILSRSLNMDEILPSILEQLEKVIPVDGSSIYLVVEEGIQLKASRGRYNPFTGQQVVSLAQLQGAAEIIKNKAPLLISDTRQNPHWHRFPNSPLQAWLGVPLIVEDEVVGILNMDAYAPYQLNESHIPLARAFADQAALAIANARLYGQAKRRADLLTSVQEIGIKITASLEVEEVLNAVTTAVLNLLEAGQVRIYLYEAETDTFTLAALLGNGGQLQIKLSLPRKDGLTAQVARSGEYVAIPDIAHHPLYGDQAGLHGFRSIISAPLKKGERVLGVLNVFYAEIHHFTRREIDVLHLLANQAAVALDNARLYGIEQTRLKQEARRVEQLSRVQEISSTLNASLDLDKVLSNACEQFVRLIDIDHCGVILFDSEWATGRVVAEYPLTGSVGTAVDLDFAAFWEMIENRQPFVSPDVRNDPRLELGRASLEAIGVQSILIAPLVVQNQVIGSFGLDAIRQPRTFTGEELNLIRIVVDQMAIAITNARTYEAERTARIQADTLRQAAATLNETLNLNEVLERILAQLERVITCDTSSIIWRDRDIFRIVAARGFPDQSQVIGMTFVYAEALHFQEIVRSRRPIVIPDTFLYQGWNPEGPSAQPIRSWIGVPLIVSDRLIGILSVDHTRPNFYSQADTQLVTAFADLAAIALENARLYEVEVKQVEQELHIAHQIQQGFLPKRLPDLPGWTISAVCLPARETGGDFYEFVERPDGLLGIVVGDVSGKSIPAAMLMVGAQSAVRAKGSDHRSPARVMIETNRLLYGDVPKGAFVAASYALVEPQQDKICLSSGGQIAPFLVPANGQPIRLIETAGERLPMGILPEVRYEETTLTLGPGDTLVFHTDGLVEQHNQVGSLFGFERVIDTLDRLRGQSPEIILRSLLEAAHQFSDGNGPHDDVTLVVVQRVANGASH